MCLAMPGQIKKIGKGSATVLWGKTKKEVRTNLEKNLKTNDWVLVQNNCIIKKLTNKEIKEFFNMIKRG
jgi:hydrogenase maturation factor